MKKTKFTLLLAAFLIASFTRIMADDRILINVPTGGNSYITAGSKPGAKINHYSPYGITSWIHLSTVISTYVKIKNTGTLNVGIRAKGPQTNTIRLTVNGQSFSKSIPAATAYTDHYFGTVNITDTGYIKIDIQGTTRAGSIVADVMDIMIGGDATAVAPVYAAEPSTTPGAGFYWVRRGSSLNLSFAKPSGNYQWMYHELMVPAGNDPIGTYYMSNGFSGGYMGIQVNSETERRVLFSVWNPSDMSNGGTVVVKTGDNVAGGSFSGEGEGTNTIFPFQWITGNKYGF
ncbi:DUF5077 domain-containing protein [Niabella hibiscisoli]|nr:DUF5077 domain-containing protein [Niabella hibiscisoli]MCH5718029.1 DUF5077 domain-containing protein [Niabella hibiscisoli]